MAIAFLRHGLRDTVHLRPLVHQGASPLDEVTVTNFRCFAEEQTAPLAPLTILVGENSTGKTSFMALVRVLWDVAFREQLPNFKEPPYDLGSFDEIAHHRGGSGGQAQTFEAGFSMQASDQSGRAATGLDGGAICYLATFRADDAGVLPSVRRLKSRNVSAECRISESGHVSLIVATSRGAWRVPRHHGGFAETFAPSPLWRIGQRDLPPFGFLIHTFQHGALVEPDLLERMAGTEDPPGEQDVEELRLLQVPGWWDAPRPFPGAPVRSRPRRTYDLAQAIPDPEGEHVPMLLATLARKDADAWRSLKRSIEAFGREAGLFDEIRIRVLGGKAGGPFQVEVRKSGKRSKGPRRNVIDVGYGVSQILPVVTELLRDERPRMFLLQQPEVHLHPSAQAALGGLLCRVASGRRKRIVVETHSDHLIDRIRMDIRDGRTGLKPDDVSILYFQRRNLSVTIHSLGWDAGGSLIARRGQIPEGYRQFFRAERRRSLGL